MTAAPGASAPPLDELTTLLRQAQAGDRSVLPALRAHMQAHPEYWVQQGNLSREIRDLLITQLSVGDLVRHEAITRWCDAQFHELAGPTPSPLEAMLVGNILTCWLDLDRIRLLSVALDKAPTRGDQQEVQGRLDAAHNRLLKAVKTLAQIRKLGVPVVQVNIGTHQVNTAG
jgi:hypothetical protein